MVHLKGSKVCKVNHWIVFGIVFFGDVYSVKIGCDLRWCEGLCHSDSFQVKCIFELDNTVVKRSASCAQDTISDLRAGS